MPRNRIREIRQERDFSQQRLAAEIGVDTSTVSRWEAGKQGIPDWRKAQLAEVLEVSVPFLMGWQDNREQAISKENT